MSKNWCLGLLLFCLDLELLTKMQKTSVQKPDRFEFLQLWVAFQQKILNSAVVGARQSFKFFRKNLLFRKQ